MKQTLFILALITSTIQTFAQSPRIKLNQITKDSVTGSVLISSPTDSGMVYSRDLFISYGADTVLILGGDTISLQSDLVAEIGDSLLNYVSRTELSDSTTNIRTDIPLIIADSLLNYVNISGTQTITGEKTFTNTLTQSGGDVNFDSGTFFVDANQNKVGIGTTNPNFGLELNGTGLNGILSIFRSGVNGGGAATILYNYSDAKTSGDAIVFPFNMYNTNNAIVSYASISTEINSPTASSHSGIMQFSVTNSGVQGEAMRINSNRELFIVYTTDQGNYRLQVKDSAYIGGNVSANAYTTRSDIRLKQNITEYQNGLNDVMSLYPVYFYQKEFPSKQRLGFIAQDVRNVIPQAITDNEQDDYLGIEYSAFSAVLVKAIQEQQAIIESIQTELDAKSSIIESQATEIEQLKTLITELSNRLQILENN